MRPSIVFATNNHHKLEEIRKILTGFDIVSLEQLGCHEDIPETAMTLEGNALIKARYINSRYPYTCFADDTGLEIEALNGRPGVFSARYAGGEGHDSQANMEKVLSEMQGKTDRKAAFRTVIALIDKDGEHLFEGRVDGTISATQTGGEGFGYDPIFIPDGYDKSFAELGPEIKNKISHRAKAVQKLAAYLLSPKREP